MRFTRELIELINGWRRGSDLKEAGPEWGKRTEKEDDGEIEN